MKKNTLLALLFVVGALFLFQVSDVFAVTCTQNGSTAYCTDTSTGRTTTYNQYGNNIYGSDGSSYTMYGNTTYGSGNIFNTGGSSGSSLPGVSATTADLNSPEVKAAKAKLDEACAKTPSAPGEVIFGGAQATNCSNATAEWLRVLSEVQENNTSSSNNDSDDYYSDYSDSNNESSDEYTAMLERVESFLESYDKTQSVNSCVSNSHQENNLCVCDKGFFPTQNKGCIPFNKSVLIEFCPLADGIISPAGDDCVCKPGDMPTKLPKIETSNINGTLYGVAQKCAPTSVSSKAYTPTGKNSEVVEANFEVKPEDIFSLNKIGNTNTEAKLRQCPSLQCSRIGSYPKGTPVEIVGKYTKDTWLKVKVLTDLKTGWMHQSLVDGVVITEAESKNNASEPIRMTRAEYEAKYGVPPPTEVENRAETKTDVKKASWFGNLLGWFGL